MDTIKELRYLVKLLIGIGFVKDENEEDDTQECLSKMADLMIKDIDETIRFIEEECTKYEYIYLAELLPELTYRSKDDRFIICFDMLEEKYMDAYYGFFVVDYIEEAKRVLETESL